MLLAGGGAIRLPRGGWQRYLRLERKPRGCRIRALPDSTGHGLKRKKGAPLDAPFSHLSDQADYAQVITPLVMSQVFADCECVAVALHEGGGPATLVTTIVTFCDGVNPWRGAAIVAVPPK